METRSVQCPKCGATAEVVVYYLGGYGEHLVAQCQDNPDHQCPVIHKAGQYHEAVYQRRGGDYRIVTRKAYELQRAQARYLGASDFAAWLNGGEAWEYPEAENPDPAPEVLAAEAEAERQQAAERLYIAIPTRARMPENMEEVL